ncbi:protein phosphatase 2C domain-containing protein [Prevotella sp. P4-119]|uniref:protein phosphatase 2C domain-containing protein n=1 Tax=Prevotella sp. P4-119 TaxID=2024218 RepID=UPI000B9698D6|nr:protein phosphatase 2C domain-containing protein [Prevotella sp. P4-119]OYP42988.1 hypothetical protein CIK89_10635 [Prevotella sp. P4-119]
MIRIKTIGGFSKQGKRDNNEDYVLFKEKYNPDSRFIILCDGMGGHGHGEVASQTVADTVFEYLKSLRKEEYDSQDLQDAVNVAQSTLTAVNTFDDKKSMGTTLIVAVINKMNILVGHIGDSRCYLFDENGLKKFRTKDHSKVAEAIDAEILTEEEAFDNSHKNLLTRCVMAGKTNVQIEVDNLQIENNDRMLLCSDGINDAMRDKEIEESMINRNVTNALDIIDSICSEKSGDNYSAIIVDFLQDEPNTIINESTVQFPRKEIEEKAFIECNHCGERNEQDAKYCRKCGTELTPIPQTFNMQSEETKRKENLFKKYIRKSFPILYILIGCLLTAVYYKISNYQIEKEQTIVDAKAQAKDLYLRQEFENASIVFISDVCKIDTTKDFVDSVIHKETLKKKYIEFCHNYKKREKK